MTESDFVRSGLIMLCCITIWPFALGLWLGWTVKSKVQSLGWWGLIPRFIRERIIIE